MIIGVPKEIKIAENRVSLTDSNVYQLVQNGHQVVVQEGAGSGSFISDQAYEKTGARLVPTIKDVYKQAEMIIKVKEPLPAEYDLLQENQILYTFLHLAPKLELTQALLRQKVKAVAYETIQEKNGSLPLLKPMSEVAGRLATQLGATHLQKNEGGKGILLGGVPGVFQGHTVIIGGGTAGINAAFIAVGMGSKVTILDINHSRLEYLSHYYHGRIETLHSNVGNLKSAVKSADLLIGSVLLAGGGSKAPQLVTKEMVSSMQKGSVIIDISVDQGGCIETSKTTSHEQPTFTYDGIIHYAVPNMPSIVSRTSTYALTNTTFKYALEIANNGLEKAIKQSPALAKGLNLYQGKVTHESIARDLGLEHYPFH